jgi:hypothetical protein
MTTYRDLTKLWKNNKELFEQWDRALFREAYELRNLMEKLLEAPKETWALHDKPGQARYVEVIDLALDRKPLSGRFSKSAYTDDGELYFGLSFTFDNGIETYPKSIYHVAVAIRFFRKQLELCLWDTETMQPKSKWFSNRDEFGTEIIETITRYFKMDPFEGIQGKSTIGFIKSE